jgi:thiol-disulfide isomerase/thioredoxin
MTVCFQMQRSRLLPIVGMSLFIAALSPIACTASPRSQQQGNVIRFVRNPEAAPDFKLAGLDGKPLTLADSRGKVVLLNFWATWCGPCQAEIPDLIELQQKYKDQLQVIGLIVDEDDASVVKSVVAETRINYPVAMTSPEVRTQYGGIAALPTSFVLDTQGRIVQKHEGLRDPALYETEIRALLGLPIAPTSFLVWIFPGSLRSKNNSLCTNSMPKAARADANSLWRSAAFTTAIAP